MFKTLSSLARCKAGLVLAMAIAAPTVSAQELPRSATIGTNPQGSLYHAVGSSLAKVLSENLDSNIRIRPFTGTTQFIPMIGNGTLEMGINASTDLRSAYEGIDPWPDDLALRAISPLLRLDVSMIVPNDSDIQTVADLEGQRVTGVYTAHKTSLDATAAILAGAELTWDDVRVVPVSGHVEGIRAVAEGRADAALASFNPAVREADATLSGGVRFIPVEASDAANAAIAEIMPGASTVTRPKDYYVGFFDDIAVLGWAAILTAGAQTNEELVYQVTKTVHERAEEISGLHARLGEFTADSMVAPDIAVPYHAGAIRYFKEQGLWSDQMQSVQDELLEIGN